jgi:hypothetical protein
LFLKKKQFDSIPLWVTKSSTIRAGDDAHDGEGIFYIIPEHLFCQGEMVIVPKLVKRWLKWMWGG